jgi:microsomal dipeptidase-like Zn-dependent dipeptidase
MTMASYFDFHFHPLNKRFLTEFDDSRRENGLWAKPIRLPIAGKLTDKAVGHILQNQASVAQSVEAGISLGIASIVAIEHVFATRKGKLKLLEWEVFGKDVIVPFDNSYFDFVANGYGSYNALFEKEIMFYLWASEQTGSDQHGSLSINILSRKKQNGLRLKPGVLNLILSAEGGHNLSQRYISKLSGISDPVKRICEYRKNDKIDLFYLTLTHLSHIPEQPLCSHAYGFKLVKGIPHAFPQINGLTPLGKKVVRACIDQQNNLKYPILIDVKHMSLQGRKDFYKLRRELLADKSFNPPKDADNNSWWPVIATHMGVTGFRSGELREYIEEYGLEKDNGLSVCMRLSRKEAGKIPEGIGLDRVFFNPTSIGLYDDDIEEIAKSNGLIGVSLDARILGYENFFGRRKRDIDYFSRQDFADIFPDLARNLPVMEVLEEEEAVVHHEKSITEREIFAGRSKRELYLFCLNVLHIVSVINKMPAKERHNKKGWDFICVGSDYDGLIDSIQVAHTAPYLSSFEETLVAYLPKAEKAYLSSTNQVEKLLPGSSSEIKALLRKLFYSNGETFFKNWWHIHVDIPVLVGSK